MTQCLCQREEVSEPRHKAATRPATNHSTTSERTEANREGGPGGVTQCLRGLVLEPSKRGRHFSVELRLRLVALRNRVHHALVNGAQRIRQRLAGRRGALQLSKALEVGRGDAQQRQQHVARLGRAGRAVRERGTHRTRQQLCQADERVRRGLHGEGLLQCHRVAGVDVTQHAGGLLTAQAIDVGQDLHSHIHERGGVPGLHT